jgi:hypothetical protein
MAVGFARRLRQEGPFIGAFLVYGALAGHAIIQSRFDVTTTALLAVSGLVIGSNLLVWAARARHIVVVAIYLVCVIAPLGMASVSMLAYAGGTLGAVGDVASVWLAVSLSLVLKWWFTRPRPPPP